MPAPGTLTRAVRAALFCTAAALLASPPLAAQDAVPDFMAPGTGWTMINANATD